MPPTKATLGGVALGGPPTLGGVYDWEFRAGVAPVERAWEVSRQRADQLAGQTGDVPLRLVLEHGRDRLEVEHVYLLEILPGSRPETRTLRLADRRWLWGTSWVACSANIRRTTGEKFLLNDEDLLENAILEDVVKYATYSLWPPEAPANAWTAHQLLSRVFEQMGQPFRLGDELQAIEVQDLELDSPGAEALQAVLAYLPGVDVYMDRAGVAVVYDTRSERGAGILPALKARQQGVGLDARAVDRSGIRPASVVVLYTPEVECRFNYSEGGTTARDSASLSNVGAVPDISLTLADGSTVARHSFVDLERMFAAWGAFGALNRELSYSVLRKYMLKAGGAILEYLWANDPATAVRDPEAQARVRTAIAYWRTWFAIEPVFYGRLRAIRAVRAAILDTSKARRAPAAAYADWLRKPSLHGLIKSTDPNTDAGWFTAGYADRLSDARIAPAEVTIKDAGAGIIQVRPQIDHQGRASAIVLGRPLTDALPSAHIGTANRLALDLHAQWDQVELSPTFKLAVVLTVVPGSPNGIGRFWQEEVTAGEAGAGEARGPKVYARVLPAVATARFAWSDDEADGIYGCLRGTSPLPSSRLVDPELVRQVAVATAKRVYDAYRDEPGGTIQVDLQPELEPAGSLVAVRHGVARGRELVTEAKFATAKRAVDIWRYLPESARRALLHVLEDGELTP